MTDQNSFGVLGGDQRQVALAEALAADGATVYTHGLERAEPIPGTKAVGLEELAGKSSVVLLPMPATTDGKRLNAPFATREIPLDDTFAGYLVHKTVYGGMMGRVTKTSALWDEVEWDDYSIRDEFSIRNAVPTAEGAVEIALRESRDVLLGKKVLVVGYGRIGKVLSRMLHSLGAQVTVSARRERDFAWIHTLGMRAVCTGNLADCADFSLVFNTVPAVVLTSRFLAKLPRGAKIIDLASAPGGADLEAASRLGIPVIQALSLPGKTAPVEAGRIIRDTVYHMLEEE